MVSRPFRKVKKCRQCKGDICIHETSKQKECVPIGPSIAEQCMEILEKLLKDKEGTPEDILKLATQEQLFQIGMDPLCLVAAMGNVDVMRRFLDAGSNVNVKSTTDGSTPLMLATQNRHVVMAELLLQHGADVTAVNVEKNNSFSLAVRSGDAKLVNALWPYRGQLDINHANADGQTVLHFAAEKLWEACVGFLITNGAQINRQNNEGFTPLMVAAMKGDVKTVEKLMSSGADYLIEDVTGLTAVCWAFDSQKFDSFTLMLSKMSPKDKENFIKSRTDRMKSPSCEHDLESDIGFYEDILIPMFKRLAIMQDFRDAILKQKFIPSAVAVFNKLMKQPACVSGICFVVSLCMTQHASAVDEAVVMQFIRCRGPEFVIKALKFFGDVPRTECETRITCFFPLACMSQTADGKDWLEKNSTKVIQHSDVKAQFSNAKGMLEGFEDKGVAIWTHFWEYFETMTQYQMDRKMAELLEEEEKERIMKTKKREKKIQKRQTKRQQRKGLLTSPPRCHAPKDEAVPSDQPQGKPKEAKDVACASTKPNITFKDIRNNEVAKVTRADDAVKISSKPKDDVIIISKRPPVEFKDNKEPNRHKMPDVTFGNIPTVEDEQKKTEHEHASTAMFCLDYADFQDFDHFDPSTFGFHENQWVTVQGRKERAKTNKVNEEVAETVAEPEQRAEHATAVTVHVETRKEDTNRRPNPKQRRTAKANNAPRWADMVKGNGTTEEEPEPTKAVVEKPVEVAVKTYEEDFPVLGGMPHNRNDHPQTEQSHAVMQTDQQHWRNPATMSASITTDSEDFRSDLASTESTADCEYGRLTPSSGITDSKAVTDDMSRTSIGHTVYKKSDEEWNTKQKNMARQIQPVNTCNTSPSLFNIATSMLMDNKERGMPSTKVNIPLKQPPASGKREIDFLGLPKRRGEPSFEFMSSAKTLTPEEWDTDNIATPTADCSNVIEKQLKNVENGDGDAREEYFPELETKGSAEAVQEWLRSLCTPNNLNDAAMDGSFDDQQTMLEARPSEIQVLQQQSENKDTCPQAIYGRGVRYSLQKDSALNYFRPTELQQPYQQPQQQQQHPRQIQQQQQEQQQESKHNIAVIQPIGHGSNRVSTTNQSVTNQTPIKGLEASDRCKLTFEESLLRNVSALPQVKDEVLFPSDLAGDGQSPEKFDNFSINASDKNEGVPDLPCFPGFHDDTKPSTPGVPSQKHISALLELQLLNYYQNRCNGQGIESSIYGHDFLYYASAMGISEEQVKALMKRNASNEMGMVQENKQPVGDPITVSKQTDPPDYTPMVLQSHTEQQPAQHVRNRGQCELRNPVQDKNFQIPLGRTALAETDTVHRNHDEATHVTTRAPTPRTGIYNRQAKQNVCFYEPTKKRVATNDTLKWIEKSRRWKEKLSEISKMPAVYLRRIGDIIIPLEYRARYTIPCSDECAVLGLLADGTEVAVHVIDMSDRPISETMLQKLTSPDMSQYFLVKYRAFAIESNICYLAIDLHEYNLSEYLTLHQIDINLDPLAVNKMVWQVLKGMAYLHDNYGLMHGNLMPSTVLVDIDGMVHLSEYCLPRPRSNIRPLIPKSPMPADRYCWMPTEVVTESGNYSKMSDIQVMGMLLYYILTGGKHPYGDNNLGIQVSIQQNWPDIVYLGEEVNHLLSVMLCMPPQNRPCVGNLLKHPYFWADEKRLRFVLIAGSDVLRDMKLGIPTCGGGVGDTMIDILSSAGWDPISLDWTSRVHPIIMKEMRAFRQYKNSLVELVLFVYNSCLHFDKLSDEAREVLDEPCRYFLSMFPTLFMAVFGAIKGSDRSEKICYKPFF